MEEEKKRRFRSKIKQWQLANGDLYEFILYNLLCNVATVTNFVVLWLSSSLLSFLVTNDSFSWWIFNYPQSEGGLRAFVAFLLAYSSAQVVNFFVQKQFVFKEAIITKETIVWYVATVVFAGVISIWLTPNVIRFVQPFAGKFSETVANLVNIVVQVAINYPMMKFKIMKKV